ncbi:endonuclease domain-containing protein [uncultured Anaerovibrio sp.]|uniref:endonuclease domain-containing protein n=1 Tax=uncultured Anaerovibrio sp. TaxID=361586 RepID=UPI002627332F|nr:endonuclease domain-containing protein [uncultured Anaerovibrio sp.]
MSLAYNKKLIPIAKSLRENMTKQERHLWYDFLRQYSVRFQRQKVIDDYIVDFYCHKARLVIELDGSQHFLEEGNIKDRIRTDKLEKYGLEVLRFANNDIHDNFSGVCMAIDEKVRERVGSLRPSGTSH